MTNAGKAGHRFGILKLDLVHPGPNASAKWAYTLSTTPEFARCIRIFDPRPWLSSSPAVPVALIESGKASITLNCDQIFGTDHPDPDHRQASLQFFMEGVAYGSGVVTLEIKSLASSGQSFTHSDSARITVNVDQYVNPDATSTKAGSLRGNGGGDEAASTPFGKQPNHVGLRYTPDVAYAAGNPNAHIVAIRGRMTARIPSYFPKNSLNYPRIMHSWMHDRAQRK